MSAKMHFRNLGKSGLRVSMVGLGTWVTFGAQTSDETSEELLTLAYESGINFFDTAEVYAAGNPSTHGEELCFCMQQKQLCTNTVPCQPQDGQTSTTYVIHFADQIAMRAEIVLGKVLKKKTWRRSSYIVSSKIYWGGKAETEKGLSRKHVIEGMKGSLERLQLEYVDIVFANKPDVHTPMEETVRAFTHCINQGWAMYWGTSRWSPTEIMEAYSVARQFNLIPPVAEQTEYHLFHREKVELQMPELYHKIGIGTVIWSPLASGILTGKYDDGIPIYSRAALKGYSWLKDKILSEEGRKQQTKLREVAEISDKIGCSLSQLAIAWCLKNENVHCVILGASTVDQLYENIQSIQYVPKLTASIMQDLDRLLGNKPAQQKRDNVSRLEVVTPNDSKTPVKKRSRGRPRWP